VIGRDRDCAIHIESAAVSRLHARIILTNGKAAIEDLGSKNGTSVNGEDVKGSVALEDGDQIRIGSMTTTYRVLDTPASTLTQRRTDSPRRP
jgi:pSer/pThr/pTyr-binding forkhead associated (FHA) protein